jgi:DNA-binding beta-propeller fold protein YncE
MKKHLRCAGTAGLLLALILCLPLSGQSQQSVWSPIPLPSGKVLRDSPAGQFLSDLNAFPINSCISPDGQMVAFLNNGFGHASSGFRKSIAILNLNTGVVSDHTEPGTGLNFDGPNDISTTFYGIAFSSSGRYIYVSIASTKKDPRLGDRTQNGIRIYQILEGKLDPVGTIQITLPNIPFPKGIKTNNPAPTPCGLAVRKDPDHPEHDLIYAALTLSDAAVELSTRTRSMQRVFNLHINPAHPALPAEYPYACLVSPDGKTLYVSLYNGSAIAAVDLTGGKAKLLPVGVQQSGPSLPSSHPSHLAVHPSGKLVCVTVENSDQVALINNDPSSAQYRTVIGSFDVRPSQLRERNLWGAAPNHLTFTPDGERLFVSLGLLNALASVRIPTDVSRGKMPEVEGFIPTLWYPHTMEISRDGQTLFITSGKGKGTGTNKPNRPAFPDPKLGIYGPTLLRGSLHQISLEEINTKLGDFTRSVFRNNQLDEESIQANQKATASNPFKHVIYVIKENRTYDQLFGDLKDSNADEGCLYFGEHITPNHHRLAREFGIYDNFYCSAEVSFSGHTWSTSGINSGWNEQQWQINYSTGNFTYDSEGKNNDVLPVENAQSDVDTPQGGYIWDSVLDAGKSIGLYGEYVDNPPHPLARLDPGEKLPDFLASPRVGAISRFPWKIPLFGLPGAGGQVKGGTLPTKAAFRGAFQPLYPSFDLLFPDIFRFNIWKRDFDQIAQKQKEKGEDTLPSFSIVRLPNDHTRGVTPGGPSPDANVADNDLALGWLVEAISSNSYYWSNTAIIVLEDDSQAGCDHVDSHRSPLLFISRYNLGNSANPHVDSRFLTTASAVRTIEALLGLPSRNLMTATAPLLFSEIERTAARWHGAYQADTSNLESGLLFQEATGAIREAPKRHELVRLTNSIKMEEADEADAASLNYILEQWVATQGRLKCCAEPRHEGSIPGELP